MALRSQSVNERRAAPALARAPHCDGKLADEDEAPANLIVNGKEPEPKQMHSQPLRETPTLRSDGTITFAITNIQENRYFSMKKLRAGGSSDIYKTLHPKTSKEYAVKKVTLGNDPEILQGYLNEIKVLRELQKSDRVIKLYGYEYDGSTNILRLVLELGETNLAVILRSHRAGAPLSSVLHYWEEMLRAVQQIHEHGIVHADLKPANFLLVSGRLKLIDFRIASAIGSEATTTVVRSSGRGTFSYEYISPEALEGDGSLPFKVSFYSDVWSLGCILYNLVYGHTYFSKMYKIAVMRPAKETCAQGIQKKKHRKHNTFKKY